MHGMQHTTKKWRGGFRVDQEHARANSVQCDLLRVCPRLEIARVADVWTARLALLRCRCNEVIMGASVVGSGWRLLDPFSYCSTRALRKEENSGFPA